MDNLVECRTCLGRFPDTIIVQVETRISEEKNVLEAIEEVASIEVSLNDIFPKQICHSCFQSLNSALCFKKQVIFSHIELKKRLQPEADPLFISFNGDDARPKSSLRLCRDREKQVKKYEENGFKWEGVFVEEIENKKEEAEIDNKEDLKESRLKSPEPEESASDWNTHNDDPLSSEPEPEEKPIKSIQKTPKTRRKYTKRKPKKELSETSDSDSDIPLENLKQELKEENKPRKSRTRDDDGPRLCPICGKLFKTRQNFNSHMTTVHRKKTDKPEKISCLCPDCGRVITGTRQNFVAHRRYHHSDKAQVKKRFACDVCPRKFYREKNLVIHQRIHKGEKGYVCEICPDKSYTQIGGLILHRRKVHLKKPTCTCNYCGKQFYEKHYLETHIRQWHTGERPFSCEICGKAFSCNGTLLRHRKDSHGEKQPCPKCGKMYTEGELRKHLKRHKIREEGIKRKKYTCEYCGTEMNFTSRKRHLLKQHGIMLRGRGETAERVPVSRADAM